VDESKPAGSFIWIYLIAFLAAAAVFGVGLYLVVLTHEWAMLAAGCLSVVAVFVSLPIALMLSGAINSQLTARQLSSQMQQRIEQMTQMMSRISEAQLLSDRAKSVAFRDKDREAIRRAIHEELSQGEWEAAYALADQFEKAFGSKSEADRFRGEINEKRGEGVKKQIAEVMEGIDRHTHAEQWTAALREAEKLMARYPNDAQVKFLPVEIENRRQSFKKQLLHSWHEAVARHDVDASIEILRQLDPYLTPSEAQSMQDTARGVFREKLSNLGADFTKAVLERRWADAIKLGETIQAEFPNSRIAQEVRDKMTTLRQRAGEPAGANA